MRLNVKWTWTGESSQHLLRGGCIVGGEYENFDFCVVHKNRKFSNMDLSFKMKGPKISQVGLPKDELAIYRGETSWGLTPM